MPIALSDEAFHSIVDAAPDAILLVDHFGTIVYVNARTEELFGYEPTELIGERVEMLVPEPEREVHNLHREVYSEAPRPRSMAVGLRLSGRRRDGSLVPVEISLSPYRVGDTLLVVAIVRDVTDLRRQEEVVRRSEARLRLVTENAADMIFRYRSEPVPMFEYVSAAATAITGYTPEDFYAHPELCTSIVTSDDRPSLLDAFRASEPTTVLVRAIRRDGVTRWFEYRVRGGSDPRGGMVTEGVLRDVTERRLEEEERQRLLAEIETQLERERIAGDLHDDIIQSVYSLGLALHGDLADAGIAKDAALGRAIDGLNSVIGDLRSYMYELSGQHAATTSREPFRTRVQAMLSGPDGPEWEVAIPDDLVLDESTERHVYLLVKELVSNVARHAHAGHASIRLRRSRGHIIVEVTDDGVGYDPAQVSDSSYGLRSIDHRVAMLRASLVTKTAPGLGTSVVVTIPREDALVIPPANTTSA